MSREEIPVTAERPESDFHTLGTDHITIWGSNAEETIEYYRDVLGMSLVLRQPNLDDPSQPHLFFDTGDGTILTFFVSDDRPSSRQPQRTSVGGVHHLCFNIDPERFDDVAESLDDHGYSYNVFDRGIFFSLYTRDHDGLIVELTADKFDFPDERKGEVLATTQRIREEAGAEYAETKHMRKALEELGLEVREYELPDATSGTAGM
jgi:catechol 2,3-dioxygenase-like lactoylglutathione lyase family enzyme